MRKGSTYQSQSPQRRVVRIWQIINCCVEPISPCNIIRDSRSFEELAVCRTSKHRIRKFPEELLQKVRRNVDVVEEALGVSKIDGVAVVVKLSPQLGDVIGIA
jgi:hypothetical protein